MGDNHPVSRFCRKCGSSKPLNILHLTGLPGTNKVTTFDGVVMHSYCRERCTKREFAAIKQIDTRLKLSKF